MYVELITFVLAFISIFHCIFALLFSTFACSTWVHPSCLHLWQVTTEMRCLQLLRSSPSSHLNFWLCFQLSLNGQTCLIWSPHQNEFCRLATIQNYSKATPSPPLLLTVMGLALFLQKISAKSAPWSLLAGNFQTLTSRTRKVWYFSNKGQFVCWPHHKEPEIFCWEYLVWYLRSTRVLPSKIL